MGERIAVAMSGGVDSSVAAWLLQREGHELMGVTLRLFDRETPEGTCGASDDLADARAVAERLGMPHQVLDCRTCFRERVIRPFAAAYEAGCTPNPCVDCNRGIKFGELLRRSLELGAEAVATGHYVRMERDGATGRCLLKKALHPEKDQSYVLYSLTQEQLSRSRFPLGGLSKEEIRAIAARQGFGNAEKKESQDICFVPDGDYTGFIEAWCRACRCEGETLCTPLGLAGKGEPRSAPTETGAKKTSVATAFEPGEIVNREGRVLGEHAGLIRYTIGQRKGIGVAAREPLYVLGKDAFANQLIVGFKDELLSSGVVACDVNLISGGVLEGPREVQVKTHYRQRPVPAVAEQTGPDELTVTFDEPQRAAAPGQAAVLYEGDIVLGGGTIVRAF